MCTLYVFIDASTDAYEEDEEVYEEEEEEPCANCTNCVNCTNQGKLILVQASKDTIAIYLFREPYQSQVFILQAFILSRPFYSLPLSESRKYYKSIKLNLDSYTVVSCHSLVDLIPD